MQPAVGQAKIRKEGIAKVTGRALYIDDVPFGEVIYGATIRSSVPRGKIKSITYDPKIRWNEFTIVTAKDIPGANTITLILTDQPALADGVVNHQEEAVVLLAHPDRHYLEEARQHVIISYDEMPAVLSLEESLRKDHIIWGKDNLFKTYHVQKGDFSKAAAAADFIIEGTYETGAQEQLYIEPNGVVARANAKDGVTIWGSVQCPYYVQKALMPLFDLPPDKTRIIQAETGGGFGGKEEYPSMIAGHAALLAWKSGKTVKLIYDRAEDMVATTKRHPSRTRVRTAMAKSGKILGLDIEFVIDGGAYATLSSVVLSRGTIHAAGPYDIEHVEINAKAVATNTPPHGAFRGFGAPQSIFALERHLDVVAKQLKISPEDIRKKNFIRHGQTTATGQIVRDKVDMNGILDKALAMSSYKRKQEEFAAFNKTARHVRKGIGFASFFHGGGFTGSGEKYLASIVGIEGTADGDVRVLAASTEIGQGTNTVFSQIAADALGIDYDAVDVAQPDTASVPNSGPTVASRTTMVVGKLVEDAATLLKQTLVECKMLPTSDYDTETFKSAVSAYVEKHGTLKCYTQYKQPSYITWDDEQYRGDAYGAYAWATYVAEVTVDLVTYNTKVDHFYAVQEVGKVINPVLAAGQIEGGVAQGVGYAITEKVNWQKGRMANGQMTNYIMPTAVDVPDIHVAFFEDPYENGPQGAKGIGELPMDGPGPAILNAMAMAVDKSPTHIPFMPEDLMQLMTGDA